MLLLLLQRLELGDAAGEEAGRRRGTPGGLAGWRERSRPADSTSIGGSSVIAPQSLMRTLWVWRVWRYSRTWRSDAIICARAECAGAQYAAGCALFSRGSQQSIGIE